jgi:hypothetical protein
MSMSLPETFTRVERISPIFGVINIALSFELSLVNRSAQNFIDYGVGMIFN